jgi:hypothetical protein
LPHPALSKGEGEKVREAQVLSLGEDLGEARRKFEAKMKVEARNS